MEAITGIVMEGKRRGSALGYPTANVAYTSAALDGIYAGVASHDGKKYKAAVFADPLRGLVEVHLLDFFGDLYGHEITVDIQKKIRDSEVFESDAALTAAIAEDVNAVRQCLSI